MKKILMLILLFVSILSVDAQIRVRGEDLNYIEDSELFAFPDHFFSSESMSDDCDPCDNHNYSSFSSGIALDLAFVEYAYKQAERRAEEEGIKGVCIHMTQGFFEKVTGHKLDDFESEIFDRLTLLDTVEIKNEHFIIKIIHTDSKIVFHYQDFNFKVSLNRTYLSNDSIHWKLLLEDIEVYDKHLDDLNPYKVKWAPIPDEAVKSLVENFFYGEQNAFNKIISNIDAKQAFKELYYRFQ